MKRKPAVSGQFYPSSPSKLAEQINDCIEAGAEKKAAIGIVSPHAGIMYSGKVAGAVFSRIIFPRTFILLGPNHTGMGSPVSVMNSGEWEMPTGKLKVDNSLADKIIKGADIIENDFLAHQMEHSLEVQLPFVLHFSRSVDIVPITMMTDSLEVCRIVGNVIADVVMDADYPVVIIASSDMSHYISDSAARHKDKKAIERVLALDPEGLFNTVKNEGISMCGVIPVTTMLFAANKIGAKEAALVKYMTSGEVSGDHDYVVGYAGMLVM